MGDILGGVEGEETLLKKYGTRQEKKRLSYAAEMQRRQGQERLSLVFMTLGC